jgi:AcrR family transcriptional regulator
VCPVPATVVKVAGADRRIGSRRPEIIAAAAQLFATEGYHGASMRSLAKATSLQAGSLYSHFAGKDELLVLVVERYLDAAQPRLEAIAARATDPGAERFAALVAAAVESALALPDEFLALSSNARLLRTAPQFDAVAARIEVMKSCWAQVQADGARDGTLRSDLPPGAIGWVVFSAITGVVDGRYSGAPHDPDSLVGVLAATLLDGVRAR